MPSEPAMAMQTTKNIFAVYNNIKIVVDGRQIITDSHNEPFIYNGTTYLPVRAVGEAVGKEVAWNGDANTVYLGHAEEDSTASIINFYVDNKQVQSITLQANQAPTHYSVSLSYGQQLRIEKTEGNRWRDGYDAFLADCVLQ